MSKKTIRIYGCGGAGVNIASHFTGRTDEPGYATIQPCIIDTSRSNVVKSKLESDDIYLVDGLDGSGKIRAENHTDIAKSIKKAMVQLEPADFNIVVFGAGGGSGSVIGPYVCSELLEQKIPVIAVVVGSDDSVISAENTLKTLMSLEHIAHESGTSLVMSYHSNAAGIKRSTVDESIHGVISSLSLLTSGENIEMDYRDLVHWLQYNKINNSPAHLVTLHVATDQSTFNDVGDPISVASLYTHPDAEHIVSQCDYSTIGYADLSKLNFEQMHFVVGLGDVDVISEDIKETVTKMTRSRDARIETTNALSDSGNSVTGKIIL